MILPVISTCLEGMTPLGDIGRPTPQYSVLSPRVARPSTLDPQPPRLTTPTPQVRSLTSLVLASLPKSPPLPLFFFFPFFPVPSFRRACGPSLDFTVASGPFPLDHISAKYVSSTSAIKVIKSAPRPRRTKGRH